MIDLKSAEILFNKIYDNSELTDRVMQYINDNPRKIEKYVSAGKKGKWNSLMKKDPFLKLCVTVAFLPIAKEEYGKMAINDEVFFETMSDIKIWVDDNMTRTGEYGLFEMNWIYHHLNLEIFKLGRLQFQLTKYRNKTIKNGLVTVSFGDKILNLHIPRGGGKLSREACLDSFSKAKAFFGEFYPDYPTDHFSCGSWLLYSGNKNFMKNGCNILDFASMFDIVEENEAPSQSYLWLFGVKVSNSKLFKNMKKSGSYGCTEDLPVKTELQKDAVNYIKNGGKLGDALGVVFVDKP